MKVKAISVKVDEDIYEKIKIMADNDKRSIANLMMILVLQEWERRHDDRTV